MYTPYNSDGILAWCMWYIYTKYMYIYIFIYIWVNRTYHGSGILEDTMAVALILEDGQKSSMYVFANLITILLKSTSHIHTTALTFSKTMLLTVCICGFFLGIVVGSMWWVYHNKHVLHTAALTFSKTVLLTPTKCARSTHSWCNVVQNFGQSCNLHHSRIHVCHIYKYIYVYIYKYVCAFWFPGRGFWRVAPCQEFQSLAWDCPNSCSHSPEWAWDPAERSATINPLMISATEGSRSEPIFVHTRPVNSRNGAWQPPSSRSHAHFE